MAAAESCTGGLVGHVITQVPRSSDHFLGGIVSYSDAVKEELLGVPGDLLDARRRRLGGGGRGDDLGRTRPLPGRALALAVTGIAGPDGGSAEKPVGLTYVAAAVRDGTAIVERHTWQFDRDGNKRASALAALELAARLAGEG